MGIQMTASCSLGKTAIGHDNRIFVPGNVDPERSKNNEYLIRCQTVREAYEEVFGTAVAAYNDKQKRKDRQIQSYYDKIRDSKNGEHLTYEYVLQVGSRETNPTGGEYEGISKEIYREWLKSFTAGQDNLKVINASIHCDEPNGTPHMHITIVPVAHYSRGLSLRNSLSSAMKEMGYTRAADWCLDVQKQLGELLQEKGIEYIQLGTHREHIENGLFQELMDKEQIKVQKEFEVEYQKIGQLQVDAKELKNDISSLVAEKGSLETEKNQLLEDSIFWQQRIRQSRKELSELNEEIKKNQDLLEKLQDKISSIISSFKEKLSDWINSITIFNTCKRIEKTLGHLPAKTVNEFKDAWNMYDNELPCFRLKYNPPSKERIRDEYFAPWKKHFRGLCDNLEAHNEFYRLMQDSEFSENEINWIFRAIGGTENANRDDIEHGVDAAYEIAMSHYAKRMEATPEDLKKKYLNPVQDLLRDDPDLDLFL